MGGVGFEDVAVSGFQLFQDTALVHHTGSTVIGKCTEKNRYRIGSNGSRTKRGLYGVMSQLVPLELHTMSVWLFLLYIMLRTYFLHMDKSFGLVR